jgi:hypothetical protein
LLTHSAPLNERVTWPSLIVAVIESGGVGRPAGVEEGDWTDAVPVPTALIAWTVNVYGVPFVNPTILQ